MRHQNLPTIMKFLKSLFPSANLFALDSTSVKSLIEKWPQIKAYYEILFRAYQAAEKGNLDPIKSDSEILLAKAQALTIEEMPAEYRNPKTIETLHTLNKQTKIINDLVRTGADEAEIKLAFAKLHDVFHSIVRLCLSDK